MFKVNKYKKYYIIIIIICILLILFSFIITDKRKLSNVERIIKDSILIVNRCINTPIKIINNKIEEFESKEKIYHKYKKIKKEYKQTKVIEAKYDDIKKELEELKKTLNLNNRLKEEYINASVIIRNIGYFYNELTIDKGEKDGLKKNMAVITEDGLVGTITKISRKTSIVKLITTSDINNKISVKIKVNDDYLYGLLVGYKDKYFIIEGIADNKDIPKGSIVTTTGLGSDIPSGILIGKVKKIKKDNFDLSRTLLVKSNVNFDNINYVTIIKENK